MSYGHQNGGPWPGHTAVAPVSTGQIDGEPVTAEDVRGHLRLLTADEDAVIAAKISAARRRIEARTERSLFRNQFDQAFDRFPCDGSPILLLKRPAVSVESVTWYGTTGGATVLSTAAYFVDTYSDPARLCLNAGYCWPSGTRDYIAGVIRYTAGYSTDAAGVPDPLKEAVRKLVTDLYENREASSLGNSVNDPLPYGVEELIADYIPVEVF